MNKSAFQYYRFQLNHPLSEFQAKQKQKKTAFIRFSLKVKKWRLLWLSNLLSANKSYRFQLNHPLSEFQAKQKAGDWLVLGRWKWKRRESMIRKTKIEDRKKKVKKNVILLSSTKSRVGQIALKTLLGEVLKNSKFHDLYYQL